MSGNDSQLTGSDFIGLLKGSSKLDFSRLISSQFLAKNKNYRFNHKESSDKLGILKKIKFQVETFNHDLKFKKQASQAKNLSKKTSNKTAEPQAVSPFRATRSAPTTIASIPNVQIAALTIESVISVDGIFSYTNSYAVNRDPLFNGLVSIEL